MKIDLPITITFDCQDTGYSTERNAGKQVFTLRYELDGDGTDALLLPGYPPTEPVEEKYAESGQAILAHITRAIDERVKNRAIRNPWDYAVGTDEERTVWQEEADEAARQDGQFGAGA
ncbi:MAG: hypothetical protein KGL39_55930 [Patescibacteria group bacterium]|nr:hypothetical protein [Patescibacteria group bacterium]